MSENKTLLDRYLQVLENKKYLFFIRPFLIPLIILYSRKDHKEFIETYPRYNVKTEES